MGDTIKKIGIRNEAGQYTYTEIGVDANNVDIDSTTLDQKISTIEEDITKKVDKVEGKGLSSNDFTDEHLSIVETMSTGIVTGIKGNAEDDYRTGDVNLTPENIGALPVDGNAASATKAEQDGNGKVISDTYILRESTLNTLEEIDANTSEENIAGALAIKSLKSNFANSIEALNSDLATKISSFEYKLSANSSIDIEMSRGIYLLACKSNSNVHQSLHVMLFGDAAGTVEKIVGEDDLYMTFSVENNVLTITNTHPNYLVVLYLVPLTR